VTSKSRKRMQDLESRICAIANKLNNQEINDWLAGLSDENLNILLAFIKGGISADTPIPPEVRAILQTRPRS
jgi:hypothetical protein